MHNDTMIAKIHKKNGKTIVAVCDSELVGKKFEEENTQLDVCESFYDGEELSDIEIGDLIRNADIVNLVGEKSVALGIEEGIIESDTVKRVKGIPHAQAIVVGS